MQPRITEVLSRGSLKNLLFVCLIIFDFTLFVWKINPGYPSPPRKISFLFPRVTLEGAPREETQPIYLYVFECLRV